MPKQSKIHEDIVQFYTAKIPKLPGESIDQWRERIKNNPSLLKEQIAKATPAEEIKLLAMRRSLAVAGGQRSGAAAGGPNNASTMARRYQEDMMGFDDESRTRFADEQVRFLDEAFSYNSPKDGTIFWSGVDPNKLAEQVPRWNSQFGSEMFGVLEATTDARFINDGFEYGGEGDTGKVTQKYFKAVSATFGRNTTGHVTAVQMWGVQTGSVFKNTELPLILNRMKSQLDQRKTPDITDISIVLLDPLGHAGNTKIYQNLDIGVIDLITKSVPDSESKWILGRHHCLSVGKLISLIPAEVQRYWMGRAMRGLTAAPSAAARKIESDYPLIKR